MGWDRGYYYRVRKVNGRVIREYVGKGLVAELAAELDATVREGKQADVLERRQQKDDLDAISAELNDLSRRIDLAARAALVAAGFHQHRRGEWRRKRERGIDTQSVQPEGVR